MLSRREFLAQSAAAAALMAMPLDVRKTDRPACTVVDLGDHCSLRESLVGYTTRSPVILSEANDARSLASLRTTGTVIIPGANRIDSSTAELILTCLDRGGMALLESGAAYGDFREHRDQVREYLDILLDPPVELWPARGIPYVEYTWPAATRVRDFSRVIPLAAQRGRIIARVGDIPVALARRAGPGTLVFLGSPLGTALWAGDAEARRCISALLALGQTPQT